MYTEQENKSLSEEYEKKKNQVHQSANDNSAELEARWHNKMYGMYVADAVFAANDGIITTFAVVAGVAGAGLSPYIIIILGAANLFADAASMALGNFLGKKSEKRYNQMQRKKEEWEIDHVPQQEKAELRKIFFEKGFDGTDLDRVVEVIASNKKIWVDIMMREELHIIDTTDNQPNKHALVTGISFITAGTLPLLPFVIPALYSHGFQWSITMTVCGLFLVGASRSVIQGTSWIKSGLEMLLVGGIAAVIAYAIGELLATLLGNTVY